MKKLFLFLLIFGWASATLARKGLVARAVTQIIRHFYSEHDDRFDLIVHGSKTRELDDIVDDLVKVESWSNPPLRVAYLRTGKDVIKIYRSAILMFDDLNCYRDFHNRVELDIEFPKKLHFLVYVKGVRESQATLLILFNDFNKQPKIVQYEQFLVHDDDQSLKLLALSMFRQPNCREWITIEVNRFAVKTGYWLSRQFFLNKFNNFNGCDLVASVIYPDEPSTGLDDTRHIEKADGSAYWGYAIEFNRILMNHLNSSLRFISFNHVTGYKSNESLTQDFIIASMSLRKLHAKQVRGFYVTDHFAITDDLIIVSRSKPHSQFYKFILPFEAEVWHWLIATLVISITVIVVTKLASKSVQNFIFGRDVTSPLLNFV